MNTAILEHENNYIKISDFINHKNDIYYNTDFNLEICSGSFSGIAFCEYDIKEFINFTDELTEMYNFNLKTATLNEICYGSNVKFEADNTGHIIISGEIFGSGMEHTMRFKFSADQSSLMPFIQQLKRLIENWFYKSKSVSKSV